LTARLWVDRKHANVQSLGQLLQEAEAHFQLLLYTVGQDQLRVLHGPLVVLLAALCCHFLLELGLFVC